MKKCKLILCRSLASLHHLQMNETLLVLKLNGNKICNEGALAIAGSLQVNQILQELDLAETDMVRNAIISRMKVDTRCSPDKALNTHHYLLCHYNKEEIHITTITFQNVTFSCLLRHVLTDEFRIKATCQIEMISLTGCGELCGNGHSIELQRYFDSFKY